MVLLVLRLMVLLVLRLMVLLVLRLMVLLVLRLMLLVLRLMVGMMLKARGSLDYAPLTTRSLTTPLSFLRDVRNRHRHTRHAQGTHKTRTRQAQDM